MEAIDRMNNEIGNVNSSIMKMIKISLIGNIILVVLLMCLYKTFIVLPKPQTNLSESKHHVVCIPVVKALSDVSSHTICDVMKRDRSSGNSLCCVHDSKIVIKMLQKTIEATQRRYNPSQDQVIAETHTSDWTNRPYSAHIYANPSEALAGKLVWTTDDDLHTAHINQLQIKDNKILVPEQAEGLYYIYSVITIKIRETRRLPPGNHKMVLTGNSSSFVISKTDFSGEELDSKYHSTSLSVIHYLSVGDNVGVQVHAEGELAFDDGPYSNYFGLFAID